MFESEVPPELLDGTTLLFEYLNEDAPSGVWALEPGGEPVRVVDLGNGPRTFIALSPDGRYLAWRDLEEEQIVVHDLLAGEEHRLAWLPDWRFIDGLSPDGSVRVVLNRQDIYGQGIKEEILLLDPHTGSGSATSLEYVLPGYVPSTGPRSPSPSISPDGSAAMYWADNGMTTDIVLRDLRAGKDIWILEDSGYAGFPSWTGDSSHVAIGLRVSDFVQVFVISRAGAITALTHDPLDRIDPTEYAVLDMSWSPGGQYLAVRTEESGGFGGYILDGEGAAVLSMCIPEGESLAYYVWASQGGFLVYRLSSPDDVLPWQLLDIVNWTYYNLLETQFGVEPIGWTSIDIEDLAP